MIEENCVRYCLFTNEISKDELDCKNKLDLLLASIANLILEYPWNFTPFHLRYVNAEDSHCNIAHFEGITNFDENIHDEWFIVYLLYQLTLRYENLVVQIQDSDGDFLLIEAADELPKWVKPDVMDNRYFIHKGALHFIDKLQWEGPISDKDLLKAIQFVRDNSDSTKQSQAIQQCIEKRIREYPDKITQMTHKCTVRLPSKVAFVLKSDPKLLMHAIRAFVSRDEKDIFACRLMQNFPPTKFSTVNVRPTRYSYAQLQGQNFVPDSKLDWPMPNSLTVTNRASELGFKITCGFEILLCLYKKKQDSKPDTCDVSFTCNEQRWKSFKKTLTDKGYFGNNLEGSAEYKKKENFAKNYFKEHIDQSKVTNFLDLDYEIGKQIYNILAKYKEENHVNSESISSEEENDDWLNEMPDYFVKMEQESQAQQLVSKIPQKLDEFITTKTNYKGAKLPQKQSLKEKALGMISENLRNILTMKVSESSELSDSDLSDYNDSSEEESEDTKAQKLEANKKRLMKLTQKLKKTSQLEEDDSDDENEDVKEPFSMRTYMQSMDHELSETCLAKSFEQFKERKAPLAAQIEDFDESEENDEDALLNVDAEMTAMKNILESFKSQNGLAGPSSNLLSSMGLHLPRDEELN